MGQQHPEGGDPGCVGKRNFSFPGSVDATSAFHVVEIPRRALGPKDVRLKVDYCGICHSDLHAVSYFPIFVLIDFF